MVLTVFTMKFVGMFIKGVKYVYFVFVGTVQLFPSRSFVVYSFFFFGLLFIIFIGSQKRWESPNSSKEETCK